MEMMKDKNQFFTHSAVCSVLIMCTYLWQATYWETLTKHLHVLLGHWVSICQYKPLTSQRTAGVIWGHCLLYNGAVIWGSTCALPEWSHGYDWWRWGCKWSAVALAWVSGSVCFLGAVLLQPRWVRVGSMLTAAHRCKDLLVSLVEKLKV